MTFFKSLFAMVLGFGALSTGCLGAADDADADMDMDMDMELDGDVGAAPVKGPGKTALWDPGGTGSGNNLPPPYFKALKNALAWHATHNNLAFQLGTKWYYTNTYDDLLTTVGWETMMKYAVRCALPYTMVVIGGNSDAYKVYEQDGSRSDTGGGVLSTTQQWKTQALTSAQAADLLTCMAALLNPYNTEVPIALSGPSVVNSAFFNDDAYTFDEALWVTENSGDPILHVWPLQDMYLRCEVQSLTQTLLTRVCGTPDSNCGLVIHHTMEDCTESEAGWTCLNRPAIKTKLKPQGSDVLYAACSPPLY